MNWFAAMVCLLPLLAAGSPRQVFGFPIPWGAKLRTWVVLFAASLAAWVVISPVSYGVIDAIAGYLVLRHPRGEAQRAIGFLFVGMLGTDIGFFAASALYPGPHDLAGYLNFSALLGWLQWACLAAWGAGDVLKGVVHTIRHGRNPVSARDGF